MFFHIEVCTFVDMLSSLFGGALFICPISPFIALFSLVSGRAWPPRQQRQQQEQQPFFGGASGSVSGSSSMKKSYSATASSDGSW